MDRRSGRAALVATGVLAPGLLLAHGLREGEGYVVAIAVAAALIVVLVLARVSRLVVDVGRFGPPKPASERARLHSRRHSSSPSWELELGSHD
jgi:hypothetical protein